MGSFWDSWGVLGGSGGFLGLEELQSIMCQTDRHSEVCLGFFWSQKNLSSSSRTGGAAFFVPDGSGPEYINNALTGCLDFLPSIPSGQKKKILFRKTYKGGHMVEATILGDDYSQGDSSIQIDYDLSGPFTVYYDSWRSENKTIDGMGTLVFSEYLSPNLTISIVSEGMGEVNFLTLLASNDNWPGYSYEYSLLTDCWTNAGQEDVNIEGSDPDKIVVYGKVTLGSSPVLQAEVSALLTGDQEDEIELRDDGVAPDIIKNDGIYSAYCIPTNTNTNPVEKTRYSLVCNAVGIRKNDTIYDPQTNDTFHLIYTQHSKSLPSSPNYDIPICCGSRGVKVASIFRYCKKNDPPNNSI